MSVVSIDAPHFNAGVVFDQNTVKKAAPIIKYMTGWSKEKMVAYCESKGWKVLEHTDTPTIG